MQKVLVPLADGFEDVEAVAIIDVLRRGGVEVVTASLGGDEPRARSAHGLLVETEALLEDVLEEEYDAIILPGGGEGTKNLKEFEPLLLRLQRQKQEGKFVCAICAAPTVLEAAGVIEQEQVTCYPSCAPEMARPLAPSPVVADGQIITGDGPGSALLFALAVLSALAGQPAAHRIANGMLVEFG